MEPGGEFFMESFHRLSRRREESKKTSANQAQKDRGCSNGPSCERVPPTVVLFSGEDDQSESAKDDRRDCRVTRDCQGSRFEKSDGQMAECKLMVLEVPVQVGAFSDCGSICFNAVTIRSIRSRSTSADKLTASCGTRQTGSSGAGSLAQRGIICQ